ncbi:putative disease resistance RPP13-like protein 3 isoform X1 [Panicum miliaceum]|uniref:Disease resistance RPP13-like protein 3 isoform X1 n=1 Tax=Panicum miliaceum TaxID=4540 RepID=A0A3L6SXZ0_PANMI|nr:putative disease resistance RPP13-like protein 3 isoform X1 [Panicum miliaceum]
MLYLGIYPEDYTIDKNDLTRQWVAEGFICKDRGIDPEDIAKSYFIELINRSMIQPVDTDYNGDIKSCRVHDMMLDLILHKSREENFITVMDDMQDMTGHQDKIHRISLNLDDATNDTAARSVQLSQVRTLARFGTSSQLLSFKLFKHLRVLGIEISGRPKSYPSLLDLTGICYLFQLRFLKIVTKGYQAVLPSKIGGLQQLETFDLACTQLNSYKGTQFPKLPSDIFNLDRLLHLAVPSGVILPDGIGNMKSLRTLGQFDLGNSLDSIKGLRELTNLTNLEINYDYSKSGDETAARCREVMHTLENLCNLKQLHINSYNDLVRSCLDVWRSVPAYFFHLQSFHAKYQSWFSRVPKWIGQLHSLYDLKLSVREVLEDDVGTLSQLPSLIHLVLHIRGAPENKIIIPGGSGLFPVLKHFKVLCRRISYLTFEAGAMPKLESLELDFNAKGWDRYGAAPAGIEHLTGLKEISAGIGGGLGAKESNRRAAESAMRDTADMHPRRPVANINVHGEWMMFDEPEEEEEEEGNGESSSSSSST